MKKLHIVYTPWTGVGVHGGYRGDSWFKHRINIFRQYTLRSLANQSNKDFVLWFSFRPEEERSVFVEDIKRAVERAGLKSIFTFNGLMYHDDKFTNYTLRSMVRNMLMMIWDAWKYKEYKSPAEIWRNAWENKNETLPERLASSIKVLRDTLGEDYDWVYMTRIDSDDMFHKDAIGLIQSQVPDFRRSLVFDRGYIYNVKTGQVAEWNPPTNPPFHTITFPGAVFFNPQDHLDYYKDFRTHEDATRVFNPIVLDMNRYMVGVHGKHISTSWDSPLARRAYHAVKYRQKGYCYTTSGRNISTHWQSHTRHVKNIMIGREFHGEEKEAILDSFGVGNQ